MSDWYYAHDGQQHGPISFPQLVELARNGNLDRNKNLVWTAQMKDWQPAGQIPGLFDHPTNTPVEILEEIAHGSAPIDIGACIKRGYELTKRHFGTIFLMWAAYVGILIVSNVILGGMDRALNLHPIAPHGQSPLNLLISQVLSLFLALGVTRIGLNLVSGKAVTVGMLFGEGDKLLRALGASILFGLMVCVGLILLIVPGIYLSLRYGQYLTAIVDRDLGIFEAFNYSSSITNNNRLSLFGLHLLGILIVLAGLLLCGVGIVFAAPVTWLAVLVAYRWMQSGHRAAQD